jgi:hypothetical protein
MKTTRFAILACLALVSLAWKDALLAQSAAGEYRVVALDKPLSSLTAPAYLVRDNSGAITVIFTIPVTEQELATANAVVRTLRRHPWPRGRSSVSALARLPNTAPVDEQSDLIARARELSRTRRGGIPGFGSGRWISLRQP